MRRRAAGGATIGTSAEQDANEISRSAISYPPNKLCILRNEDSFHDIASNYSYENAREQVRLDAVVTNGAVRLRSVGRAVPVEMRRSSSSTW